MHSLGVYFTLIGKVLFYGAFALGFGFYFYSVAKLDIGFLATIGSSLGITYASTLMGGILWLVGKLLSKLVGKK